MLTILTEKYSDAVEVLFNKLKVACQPTVFVGKLSKLQNDGFFANSKMLIFVGETSALKQVVAETFGIPMVYDKFVETSIAKSCQHSKKALPPQHIFDKLCSVPETFNSFPMSPDFQCGCFGEHDKKIIFVVPDNATEVEAICQSYISSALNKILPKEKTAVYKIFALSKSSVTQKLSQLENAKYIVQRCETQSECDFQVVVKFKNSASKEFVSNYDKQIKKLFNGFLYADFDTSLQNEVVSALTSYKKRVAFAESITGGLISSKIVDISGASKVLYESIVAYTVESKSNRLGINPLFIDKFGVVSSEVATAMAESLLTSTADFSLSTTGFADASSPTIPVGLCFIAVGTKRSVKVYKFEFSGNRNQVRNQAANSALFLLLSAIKNTNIETIN